MAMIFKYQIIVIQSICNYVGENDKMDIRELSYKGVNWSELMDGSEDSLCELWVP
jgi:hypothetical protein